MNSALRLDAVSAGYHDRVVLDNFSLKQAKDAAEVLQKAGFGNVLLEVSGGITGENLLEYARAKVDIISMGELAHSVKALDISLEIMKS